MTLQQILTLARVPNIPTVWSNVLMAWVLAGGDGGRWPALVVAVLGGTLVYAGGCTHNDACDAAWDQRHKPERLIPSGRLTLERVARLAMRQMRWGTVLLLLAPVLLMGGPGRRPETGGFLFPLLLMGAILLYNFRHKENPASVVVMGACRALLVLSGAAAAGHWSGVPVLAAAGVVWFYIIALSLLARRESRPGGGFLKKLRPGWSVGRWVGEMLAAIPLLDAALIFIFGSAGGGICWAAVLICAAFWPLCRLLQRKYAAT